MDEEQNTVASPGMFREAEKDGNKVREEQAIVRGRERKKVRMIEVREMGKVSINCFKNRLKAGKGRKKKCGRE